METVNTSFIAKKSLGQNFLHAPNVISAMVKSGNIEKTDTVVEIGPGKGALTSKLLETGAKVLCIEKDDRAIPFLNEKFADYVKTGQLTIFHANILEFDIDFLENYIVIANIPYYITGELIRKFLTANKQPKRMVLMLQKEVAKRVVDTKESILSISIKVYGQPKYLMPVPRKYFRPMPNVDSAVLIIENISKDFFSNPKIDENRFFEIIRQAFSHKRKVLIKNLEGKFDRKYLEDVWKREGISPNVRAEEISIQMWKKIIGNK